MATTGENKQTARRFLEQVINQRRFDLARRLVSERSEDYAQESLVMYLVLSGFPDFRLQIDRMVAEGDRVAVLSTFAGTHSGEFLGVKPTGKGVLGRKIDIFTFDRQGKISGILYNMDLMNLMTQLDAFPREAMFESRYAEFTPEASARKETRSPR